MGMQERKFRLPKIGMRIIKSAVGVFLCMVADALFRSGKGMVFYAQLSVLWCMQDYISETKSKAFQRFIGTVIGCAYGLIFLLIVSMTGVWNITDLKMIRYIAVAISIVFVLYTTVLIRKKQASYFSCVVFLSIVVGHAFDLNPYLFVWNRFLDTMTGILIGVFVNCLELPRNKNRNILFISGLDDTLLSGDDSLSPYSRVELNRMISDGALFTVSTQRTQASLMEPLRGIDLKLPVIVMDGAALFHLADKRYERVYVISPDRSHQISQYLHNIGVPFFANIILDDTLLIYYTESENCYYNAVVDRLRHSPYRNYICRPYPENESIVYFMIIDAREKIEKIYAAIKENHLFRAFKVVKEESKMQGAMMLKIFNHNASKENMIEYLKNKMDVAEVVTFGTVEGRYSHCIQPGEFDRVIQIMKGEYEPVKMLKMKKRWQKGM